MTDVIEISSGEEEKSTVVPSNKARIKVESDVGFSVKTEIDIALQTVLLHFFKFMVG